MLSEDQKNLLMRVSLGVCIKKLVMVIHILHIVEVITNHSNFDLDFILSYK